MKLRARAGETSEVKRRGMVDRQLRKRGIRDARVLAALLDIPREDFIPEAHRGRAYDDEPAPIGFGQTISQPYMTALMAQVLELTGTERVLEVGGGSGYHAAVLGALAAEVISVEIIPELAAQARRNLEAAGRATNVRVVEGDGSRGYPPVAPYDAISVAAAAPDVPYSLLDQLRDPGRMVIPVGDREDQDLVVITKSNGRIAKRVASLCRFVPLLGDQGFR